MSDLVPILFGRLFTISCFIGVVYIGAAIFWQKLTGLDAYGIECVDHGEFDEEEDGCPDCADESGEFDAWDRGHDHWVNDALGVL